MSKLTLLVFVVSSLACTYAATKVTNDPIPISAIPPPWYMIPVHPNKKSASLYGDGTSTALEDIRKGAMMWVLETVYGYTLAPFVGIISSTMSIILAPLTYVGSFVGLSKVPPPEKTRARRQVGSELEADTELPPESEEDLNSLLDSVLDPDSTEVQSTDIDYQTVSTLISIDFIFNVYQYIMTWVEIFMDILSDNDDIDLSQLFAFDDVNLDEVMDSIMETAQEIAIRISVRLWSVVKTDLLPLLDSAIVEFQDSDLFSDNIKQMLGSLHATYQMAHLLDII